MSLYYFFASNTRLEEKRNPFIKMLSVNEALALNIQVDMDMFEEGFDYNKPNVILYVEDEDKFRYPNIFEVNKQNYENEIDIHKKYMMCLEWDYDETYVNDVIQYIKTQLQCMNEIELWKVWLGNYRERKTPTYISLSVSNLTNEVIRTFMEDENDYQCLIIEK